MSDWYDYYDFGRFGITKAQYMDAWSKVYNRIHAQGPQSFTPEQYNDVFMELFGNDWQFWQWALMSSGGANSLGGANMNPQQAKTITPPGTPTPVPNPPAGGWTDGVFIYDANGQIISDATGNPA
jgi:hypothetical protein